MVMVVLEMLVLIRLFKTGYLCPDYQQRVLTTLPGSGYLSYDGVV